MADTTVLSEVNGSVWKIAVKVGDSVLQDDPIIYAESMKMEIPVLAPEAGVVTQIFVTVGQAIAEGDPIAAIQT
jgi:acetyl-CoA carboxylase biotin carboxyl carrier protein